MCYSWIHLINQQISCNIDTILKLYCVPLGCLTISSCISVANEICKKNIGNSLYIKSRQFTWHLSVVVEIEAEVLSFLASYWFPSANVIHHQMNIYVVGFYNGVVYGHTFLKLFFMVRCYIIIYSGNQFKKYNIKWRRKVHLSTFKYIKSWLFFFSKDITFFSFFLFKWKEMFNFLQLLVLSIFFFFFFFFLACNLLSSFFNNGEKIKSNQRSKFLFSILLIFSIACQMSFWPVWIHDL